MRVRQIAARRRAAAVRVRECSRCPMEEAERRGTSSAEVLEKWHVHGVMAIVVD